MADNQGSTDLPRCQCGFDRTHGLVRPERHYSTLAMMMWIVGGAGTRPKSVDYRCPRCNTLIETVTDRAEMLKFC